MVDVIDHAQKCVSTWRSMAEYAKRTEIPEPCLSMTGVADTVDGLLSEIAKLREAIRRLAEQDATLSVVGGNVIVEMDATLTDEERNAIKSAASDDVSDAQLYGAEYSEELRDRAATLRGLLERLQ